MSYIKCLQLAMKYRDFVKKLNPELDAPEYFLGYDPDVDILACASKPYKDFPKLIGLFQFTSNRLESHSTYKNPGAERVFYKTLDEAWRKAKKGAEQ